MNLKSFSLILLLFMFINCNGGSSNGPGSNDGSNDTGANSEISVPENSESDDPVSEIPSPDPIPVYDTGDYDLDLYLSFEWTNTAEVTDVIIQIATDEGFENIVYGGIEGISIGNVESFDYTAEPLDGSTYYARIKVKDSYGNESIFGQPSDGIIIVGSLNGRVVDGLNLSLGIEDSNIILKRIYDDCIIYPISPDTIETDTEGYFTIENIPIGSCFYKIEATKENYFDTTINDITIDPGTNNIGQICLVEDIATTASIFGKVVDANDASPVGDATIYFYDSYGIVADTQISNNEEGDNKGTFTSNILNPGTYTIEIIKTAYLSYSADNIVVDGRDGDEDIGNQVICAELQENQVRVIVQWGALPKDLDIHCVGPTTYSVGPNPVNNRFHIRWDRKTFNENDGSYTTDGDPDGSFSTISIVQDITEYYGDPGGYGPEAINLFNNGVGYAPGIYRFTVMNCTRQNDNWYTSNPPIGMRVYNQYGLLKTVQIASGGEAYLYWKAIEINISDPNDVITEDNITVINEFANLNYNNKNLMDWIE